MVKLLSTKLYRFQSKGVRLGIRKRALGLFMEQGTGKTLTALAIAARLWYRGRVSKVLVVAPKAVRIGWVRQAERHLAISHLAVVDPSEDLMERTHNQLFVAVVNFEKLWRRPGILRVDWDMVIVDESQRIRNPTAKQSEAIHLLSGVNYRLALTGTPVGNKGELDLWSQMRFVNPSLLGKNFYSFRQWCCIKVPVGEGLNKWKLRKSRARRITKKIRNWVYRVNAREVLDLPPEVNQEVYFELTGKAKQLYKKLEDDFYAEWEGVSVSTHLPITNLLRLHQLAGGFVELDTGDLVQLEQDKLIALLDILEGIPDKVVIFARFTAEIDIIHEALKKVGRKSAILDGRTKDQGAVWTNFQDNPNSGDIICELRTGGVGVELFASCVGVFYSNFTSWIDYDQARKRLIRNGQTRFTRFIHLLGNNTIDEDIYNSLMMFGETARDILSHMTQRKQRNATMATKTKTRKTSTKPADKEKTSNRKAPPQMPKPKYGIPELAEAMGVEPATVRQKLRSAGIEKSGRVWDFGSAAEVKKLAKELKSSDD